MDSVKQFVDGEKFKVEEMEVTNYTLIAASHFGI